MEESISESNDQFPDRPNKAAYQREATRSYSTDYSVASALIPERRNRFESFVNLGSIAVPEDAFNTHPHTARSANSQTSRNISPRSDSQNIDALTTNIPKLAAMLTINRSHAGPNSQLQQHYYAKAQERQQQKLEIKLQKHQTRPNSNKNKHGFDISLEKNDHFENEEEFNIPNDYFKDLEKQILTKALIENNQKFQ
jgi:hypothetical protein